MSDRSTLLDSLKNQGAMPAQGPQGAKPSDRARAPGTKDPKATVNTTNNVVTLHPAAIASSPCAQYLDQAVDLESLHFPYTRFPGIKMVLPDREAECSGWSAFIEEIAPDPAPVIERKDQVPYYIAGTLREAELINKRLREQRLSRGESTIGKQRSSAHIKTLGPAIPLDDDGDVLAREPALRAFGAAAVIYTSHSYGFPKGDATAPALGGRVILCLNRTVTPAEYSLIWDAINQLLGGGFDEHGQSPSLCYGRHARRTEHAPYKRLIISGGALDADALIELGRSLKPRRAEAAPDEKPADLRRRSLVDEIEHAQLMGRVRPPDSYGEWVSGAAAFKRVFLDDGEAAFQCYDVWSACSGKYEGTQATRRKFDEVPADYAGAAVPVTLGMLHWRARRRAQMVISTQYSPLRHFQRPKALEGLVMESPGAGISTPKGGEPIPPDTQKLEDGIVALEYLHTCWSQKVFEQSVAGLAVPEDVLKEVLRRCDAKREKIDLAGRTLHRWAGQNLAADTAALVDAIMAAKPELYRVDRALVRIADPASDPATAQRLRKAHHYSGTPGEPGDPALHAGERIVPILPADSETMRVIIAKHVATKVNGAVVSFGFKSNAQISKEPDAGVLKDLIKRELPTRVPEIQGIITAPVMPDLPPSTRPSDLTRHGADRLITSPGLDAASGLFLSPLGTAVRVPELPSSSEVEAAADLLREPWVDFPFVSPGAEISPEVSRSTAIFGTFIAPERRALEIAPGIGFSSHGEGMSSGKTLAGEIIGTMATGEIPAPVSLSPDFTEQRKELLAHLIEGDGCLFLDNVPNGMRFDSASLAAVMTNPQFKGRLLGANKQIKVSTRSMITFTGNALNLAGDLASRCMSVRLDTALERPEDRSVMGFKHPHLREWVVEHRQSLVAAVHTIVRAYLQECPRHGGTPPEVVARRQVSGTRFGGPCEVLRDAFLWAFPDLPDPFLSFQASAANSSTKAEAALALGVLDQVMTRKAGDRCAPAWAAMSAMTSPVRTKWEQKFRSRWNRMTDEQRWYRFLTTDLTKAQSDQWNQLREYVRLTCGRREVRAGRVRFSSSEIIEAFGTGPSSELAVVEGAMQGKHINPVALGRWLKERLVDAPINGLVLRSAQGRGNCAQFWITTGGVS